MRLRTDTIDLLMVVAGVIGMTIFTVGIIIMLVGCQFVSVSIHQSSKVVDTKDGETTLSRGHDIDTEKDNTMFKIPLLK